MALTGDNTHQPSSRAQAQTESSRQPRPNRQPPPPHLLMLCPPSLPLNYTQDSVPLRKHGTQNTVSTSPHLSSGHK